MMCSRTRVTGVQTLMSVPRITRLMQPERVTSGYLASISIAALISAIHEHPSSQGHDQLYRFGSQGSAHCPLLLQLCVCVCVCVCMCVCVCVCVCVSVLLGGREEGRAAFVNVRVFQNNTGEDARTHGRTHARTRARTHINTHVRACMCVAGLSCVV